MLTTKIMNTHHTHVADFHLTTKSLNEKLLKQKRDNSVKTYDSNRLLKKGLATIAKIMTFKNQAS